MAHQPGSIAWEALAANVELLPKSPCSKRPTLHPLFKPGQAEDLNGFAASIARNIHEHSALERKKYPETYPPPAADDVVINDRVTRKISPVVWEHDLRQWLRDVSYFDTSPRPEFREEPCEHAAGSRCDCPIPREYRTMAHFLVPFKENDCYEFSTLNGKAFFALELLKIMLLYGEMDCVLRITSQPGVDLSPWWTVWECQCVGEELGWDGLVTPTLEAYIGLNSLICYRDGPAEVDYRELSIYRNLAIPYTDREGDAENGPTGFMLEPHQQIFRPQPKRVPKPRRSADGEDGRPRFPPSIQDFTSGRPAARTEGKGPEKMHDFMDSETEFGSWWRTSDTDELCKILSSRGLPAELALEISRQTDRGNGKLRVAGDPLHPRNAAELKVYLDYCWALLVRCDMMARATGKEIVWESLVVDAMGTVMNFETCKYHCRDRGEWMVRELLSSEIKDATIGGWYKKAFA